MYRYILIFQLFISMSGFSQILNDLSSGTVRKILSKNIPQMRKCYQSILDKNKDSFDFKSDVYFDISREGRTSKARLDVKLNINDSSVKKVSICIKKLLLELKFPKGNQIISVSQPINFSSK